MSGIVAEVANERASYVIHEMPLKLVFAYEHLYFLRNGYNCRVKSYEQSLEDLMTSL
tara:strand:+ start:975 stop:1145 length:171 start_codon:yes stop_codon:yes gene_type:complete